NKKTNTQAEHNFREVWKKKRIVQTVHLDKDDQNQGTHKVTNQVEEEVDSDLDLSDVHHHGEEC
ncbi:Hypothetical predicted protein, partial [Paramuricea clavata]